jgi:hypothetical protein
MGGRGLQFFSGTMVTNLSFGAGVCTSNGASIGEDDMDAVLSVGWLSVFCVGTAFRLKMLQVNVPI